jgi:hypothetical protein
VYDIETETGEMFNKHHAKGNTLTNTVLIWKVYLAGKLPNPSFIRPKHIFKLYQWILNYRHVTLRDFSTLTFRRMRTAKATKRV